MSDLFFSNYYRNQDAGDASTLNPNGLDDNSNSARVSNDIFGELPQSYQEPPLQSSPPPHRDIDFLQDTDLSNIDTFSHDHSQRAAETREQENARIRQQQSSLTTVTTSTTTSTTSSTNQPSITCPQNMSIAQREYFLLLRRTEQEKQSQLEARQGFNRILNPLVTGNPLIMKNGYNEYASVLNAPTLHVVLNESKTFYVDEILEIGDFNKIVTISTTPPPPHVAGQIRAVNPTVVYTAKVFDKKYDPQTLQFTETQEQFDLRVEHEYRLSMLIRQRHALAAQNNPLLQNMLENDLLLARWEVNCDPVPGLQRRRAIVFPFFRYRNLKEFVDEKLDGMREYQMQGGHNQLWRLQVFRLCQFICKKVAALHELGIFHRDIRLENFVIQDIDPKYVAITDPMVRIVNFTYSCATDFFHQHLEYFFTESTCAFPNFMTVAVYAPNRAYADPRTFIPDDGRDHPVQEPALIVDKERLTPAPSQRRMVLFPVVMLQKLWPAFETYSVAVCIQFIIDKDQRNRIYAQYTDKNTSHRYSKVKFSVDEGSIPLIPRYGVITEKRIVDPFCAMMKALTGPNDSKRNLKLAAREFARLERRYLTCHKDVKEKIFLPYQVTNRQVWSNLLANNVEPVLQAQAFFEPHQNLQTRMRNVWLQSRIPILPDPLPETLSKADCGKGEIFQGFFETPKRKAANRRRNEDDDDDDNPEEEGGGGEEEEEISMPFNQWLSLVR